MSPITEAIWASLPLPALVLDAHEQIAGVNPAAEQFFNSSAKLLCGIPVRQRLSVAFRLEESFARVRANAATVVIDHVDIAAGGRAPAQCTLRIAPFSDRSARLLMLLEPHDLADRLGGRARSRKSALSAIGMAEMLAHEIKNPLAGISGAAQLIGMSLDGEDRELSELIVGETRRILKLLRQVEQFGTLAPPERRAVNLHDVLERARKSAQLGFAAGLTIREEYDPSLPAALVDPDQLLQVFQNLLKNAAEAAGKDGTIILRSFYDTALRVRHADGSGAPVPLQVEIIDDGPGLPPEIAAEIFEPFVSGTPSGTGLGLALVSRIIAEHDAWVSVDSSPGHTVFRVSLPVARTPVEPN